MEKSTGTQSTGERSSREPIVGIDLGTTNSLVAVAAWAWAGSTASAHPGHGANATRALGATDTTPRVIADERGRMLLPSVVRYEVEAGAAMAAGRGAGAPTGYRARVAAVGYDAKERAVEFPQTTIASVKRLMGRSIEDAKGDLPYLTFQVVEGPNRTARVFVPAGDGNASSARGVRDGAGAGAEGTTVQGALVSPQEVSAVILRRLKEQASAALGVEVRRAVVTVPAYFDDAQRQATRDAGRLAGLDVVRVVNEPTAAALAYGIGVGSAKDASPRVIAVYDLGGGTFDVSLLRLTPSMSGSASGEGGEGGAGGEGGGGSGGSGASAFQVLSTAGDTHLGGDDFDHALVKLFTDEINATFSAGGVPLEFPPATRRALLEFAERTKIRLSDANEARIRIDLGVSERDGASRVYERVVTRAEFEALIAPLVERTIAACKRALRDARRGMDDAGETVSSVVMVGGATRTPLVRAKVREFFGLEPYTALDPDTVVALGAAVQGAVMSGGITDALLLDVVPLSLGIETVGGAAAKLIMRNSPVPTQAAEMFSTSVDGQTSIRLHVVQGEREMAADCRSLGVFHLSGIPAMPAGIPKLRVTFSLDANGVLHVGAVEERSGKVATLQVVPHHGLTRDEVDRMEAESFVHAREDMARHRVVDLIANAKLDLHWIQLGIKRVGGALDPAYAAELNAIAGRLRELIDQASSDWRSVDPNVLYAAKESLDRASVRLHEISIAESLKGSAT